MNTQGKIRRFYLFCLLVLSSFNLRADPFVGQWVSKEIKDPKEQGPAAIGWELEFFEDGRFELLSDGGMRIQEHDVGTYSFNKDTLSFYFQEQDEPWEVSYQFKGEELKIIGPEIFGWSIRLVKSDEPILALRALPKIPRTLNEAASLLFSELSDENLDYLRNLPKDRLIELHFGFGMGIRNRFSLWGGNDELLESCGSRDMHPDNASSVIIEALWEETLKTRDDYEEYVKLMDLFESFTIAAFATRNMTPSEFADRLNSDIDERLSEMGKQVSDLNLILVEPDEPEKEIRINGYPLLKPWDMNIEDVAPEMNLSEWLGAHRFSISLMPPRCVEIKPYTRRDDGEISYVEGEFMGDTFDMQIAVSDNMAFLDIGSPGVYNTCQWVMKGGRIDEPNLAELIALAQTYWDGLKSSKIVEVEVLGEWKSSIWIHITSFRPSLDENNPKSFRKFGELYFRDGRRLVSNTQTYVLDESNKIQNVADFQKTSGEIVDSVLDYLKEEFNFDDVPESQDVRLLRIDLTDHWVYRVFLSYSETSKIDYLKAYVSLDGDVMPFEEQ